MDVNADLRDSLLLYYADRGGTDFDYLKHHLPRFVDTQQRFLAGWDRTRGTSLLDIGAHWLHQSVLYARKGFQVTAMDLPLTFDLDPVKRVAADHDIRLLAETDLSRASAFAAIPDDSIDAVLFTEIIEHITFNPVALWKEIHRVMKSGSRIIVTTPNYYAASGRAWDIRRFTTGLGGGIDTLAILHTPTYGHHWKEFTLRELIHYFCLLSPDFNTIRAEHVHAFHPTGGRLARWMEAHVDRLRPNLYLEVELTGKSNGIPIEPNW